MNFNLPACFFVNAGGGAPTSVNGIVNTPANITITNNGATLGRVLFYDKNLSEVFEAFVSAINGPWNNGLDLNINNDNRAGHGEFKTHTLRNIELTTPYMHNGIFKTLEKVVDHYNSGVKAHPNLNNTLSNPMALLYS